MTPNIRDRIRRLAQDGFDSPERGQRIWKDAEAVLSWLNNTEAPPGNTIPVRIAVDAFSTGDFVAWAEATAKAGHSKARRTIVTAEVYLPEAPFEVAGSALKGGAS